MLQRDVDTKSYAAAVWLAFDAFLEREPSAKNAYESFCKESPSQLSLHAKIFIKRFMENMPLTYDACVPLLYGECRLDNVSKWLAAMIMDVKIDVKDARSIWKLAARYGYESLARACAACGDLFSSASREDMLEYVVEGCSVEYFEHMLPQFGKIDEHLRRRLIQVAINRGSVDHLNAILTRLGNAVTYQVFNETPLFRAMALGKLDVVECLLERYNAIETPDIARVFQLTVEQDSVVGASLLLVHKYPSRLVTPQHLFDAAYRGHVNMIRFLVDLGLSPNTSKSGSTTLAVTRASKFAAECSIDYPLEAAVRCKHQSAVELLLALGADITEAARFYAHGKCAMLLKTHDKK